MSQTEALGNVATKLLVENDRVKIWEMLLEPGESSDLHHHAMDYVLCILEGDSIDADPPGGKTFHASIQPGQVFFIKRGGTERAVNRGTKRFREIVIEIKDPS